MTQRRVVRLAVVLVALVAACADFSGGFDPAFGLPDVVVERPTLARDVQPLLDRRCAFGGCHSAATRQAGLALVAGMSHTALVGRAARLSPGDTLVVAGDPARSWMLRMIGEDESARRGFSRMPLAASPLTPNQRETIARWIAQGAPEE